MRRVLPLLMLMALLAVGCSGREDSAPRGAAQAASSPTPPNEADILEFTPTPLSTRTPTATPTPRHTPTSTASPSATPTRTAVPPVAPPQTAPQPAPPPAPVPAPGPQPAPAPQPPAARNCDAAYPDFCISPPPPDLNCPQIPRKDFTVLAPDPHGFDRDRDGRGCES